MGMLSNRRHDHDESDEDDYAGTHAPRDSTNLDLSRQVAQMEGALGMRRNNIRAGSDDRNRFEDDDAYEEDRPSQDEDQDEEDYLPEDNRAYEEEDLDEDAHPHREAYLQGNDNPYYKRQQVHGGEHPYEQDKAPERRSPPENDNMSATNVPSLTEQIADMARAILGRFDRLQAGQDRLEQRVYDLPRQIGAQGRSSAFDDNAVDSTGHANLSEQIINLVKQIKVPEQINADEQNGEVDHNNQVEQIDLPEEVRDRLEREDEQDGALEQPNRVSNRESILAQVGTIDALDPSAQDWLLANLWWEDRGEARGWDMTFTVGLRGPDPGWLGYWAFRSHGEGSSERWAMTNLAGQNLWTTNDEHPSADQVYELRTRLRFLGRADRTADIDLVWVPTLRLQHQSGTVGSQDRSTAHSKNPKADDAHKENESLRNNGGRRGTGIWKGYEWQHTETKSIGVDELPENSRNDNVIGDPNAKMLTRAARKASQQVGGDSRAPPPLKYTAASTETTHPSSMPKPAKSVPRKKPTHGPGKNRPKPPAVRVAENVRRKKQSIKEAKEIARRSSNPGPSTRARSQPNLSHPQAAAESEAARAAPLKRKRGGNRLVDELKESGDDQRDTDEEQPKRRSTAPSKKKQKRSIARSQKAARDPSEGQSDGDEIRVSRPGEQEDQESEEQEDGEVEDEAAYEALRRDDSDTEDEAEVPEQESKGKSVPSFPFLRRFTGRKR